MRNNAGGQETPSRPEAGTLLLHGVTSLACQNQLRDIELDFEPAFDTVATNLEAHPGHYDGSTEGTQSPTEPMASWLLRCGFQDRDSASRALDTA